MIEHVLFGSLVLRPVVRPAPDALEVGYLAQPIACSAARAVALVLGALRFGAEKRDVRQRAVAAILAVKHRGLARVLQYPQASRALHWVLRVRIDPFPGD